MVVQPHGKSASHSGMLAAPLPDPTSVIALGKTAEDGLSSCMPATHVKDQV